MKPETSRLIYGTDEPPVKPIEVRAGNINALIEPDSGQLRYLRQGNFEVLRGVYSAVRRADWGTIVPTIEACSVSQNGPTFTATIAASIREGEVRLASVTTITGSTDGEIVYDYRAQAQSTFSTCRTGVVVLHPAHLRGCPVIVTHSDGSLENSHFPVLISPHQPFFDVRSMQCELVPGAFVSVEFEGEVFETEDQRNWSDASFKTYCRPLGWGFPYTINEGQEIHHRVTLRTQGSIASIDTLRKFGITVPDIGTWHRHATSIPSVLPPLDFFIVEPTALPTAAGRPERILLRSPQPEIPPTLRPDDGFLLTNLNGETQLEALRGATCFLASTSNFTELNRNRPNASSTHVAFAVQPQVHAFDTQTIVEAAETLEDIGQTAKSFCDVEVIAGPVTLFGGQPDGRISSRIAGVYALSAIVHAAAAGINGVALFETEDWEYSPARFVVADIKRQRRWDVFEQPLEMLRLSSEDELLLANLTREDLSFGIRHDFSTVHRIIDANTRRAETVSPEAMLTLGPFEYVRLTKA